MYQKIYYEAMEIWGAGEKASISQDTEKVTKCTLFTELLRSLEVAEPELADFRLEVGGLGKVGFFFCNYSDICQKHF